MKEYVLGFIFNENKKHVVLVQKTHPQAQAGMLNGIGGAILEGEHPETAMARKCKEETGVEIPQQNWDLFFQFTNDTKENADPSKMFTVHCFRYVHNVLSLEKFISKTQSGEDVDWYILKDIRDYDPDRNQFPKYPTVDMVRALIELAIDPSFHSGSGGVLE